VPISRFSCLGHRRIDGEKKLIKKKPGCKGLLLVFDNLDRCPPHVADKLFFDYAAQLQAIDCTIVYTVPIASLYSSSGITKTFDKPYQTQGLDSLVALLDKRIDVDRVFETRDILLEIVRASGGHVRDLMKMVRQACLTAIVWINQPA
jgi:hypothetical protein